MFLVGAKRTPFGTFGGSLKNLTSQNLQLTAAKAALNQANLEPKDIDSVSIGNILHTEPASPYLARHVALKIRGVILRIKTRNAKKKVLKTLRISTTLVFFACFRMFKFSLNYASVKTRL